MTRHSSTVCRRCGEIVPASIFDRDGTMVFQSECPACGPHESVFPEDGPFYSEVLKIVGTRKVSDQRRLYAHREPLPPLRGVLLDVTGRCNLRCPHCFAAANDIPIPEPDLVTLGRWFEDLGQACGKHRPVVFLQGGEPTLRDDLPEIVSLLRERGYRMKLVTNGLRLRDPDYARILRKAGLEWVFLQFDGFSREASVALRGADLFDDKMAALENLIRNEYKILLATMVQKGVNLDQVGPIIELAVRTPRVQQISFLPTSRMGRKPNHDAFDVTTSFDVMSALAEWSHGRLRPDDFLQFLSISKHLWRLTRNPDYKPKTCFFPMVIACDGRRITPMNRLASNPALLFTRNYGRVLGGLIRHLFNLDSMPYNPNLLTMVIEHFRDPDAFDFEDALQCNKFYIAEGGLGPSCVFNTLERQAKGNIARSPGCTGAG